MIGEEQCCFGERTCGLNNEVYMAFMDLEKAYDKINRDALWQVLRVYGVEGSAKFLL